MNKRYGKNLLVIMMLTLTILLCGCGSEKEESKSNVIVSEESAGKSEGADVIKSTSQTTPQASVAVTLESTPEPTPEMVVYEGIDMESTLPGKEWISTFVGIIEEPKLIVYNDETNKKVIVEHKQEFEFGEGDKLAFFAPKGYTIFDCDMENNTVKEFMISFSYREVVLENNSSIEEDPIIATVFYNDEIIDDLVYYLKPVE